MLARELSPYTQTNKPQWIRAVRSVKPAVSPANAAMAEMHKAPYTGMKIANIPYQPVAISDTESES